MRLQFPRQLRRAAAVTLAAATLAAGLGPGMAAQDGQPAIPKPADTKAGTPMTAPVAAQVATPAPLNGATSVDEAYGDWMVGCRVVEGATRCVISQAQGHRQSGEQVFTIQLAAPRNGTTDGTIVMPFGLELDAGAVMKLDGKDLGQGLKFSTCVPQGCLLPVSLPGVATDAIGKASVFTVSSLDLNGRAPVTFKVSTNGFKAALERAARLAS